MEKINLIYSSNQRGFKGIILSVLSILDKTKSIINVNILSMNMVKDNPTYKIVSKKNIEQLREIVKKYNINNDVILHDLTELHSKFAKKTLKTSYTPYAYLRLFLDKLDFGEYNKLIYLDIDTMANGDIKELYDIDISEYQLGAVNDHMGQYYLRYIKKDYFNSGVLLINLKKCKEINLFARTLDSILKKQTMFIDQTPLNLVTTKRLKLDRRFNEQRSIKSDTIIKHFCQGIKYFPFRVYNIKQWEIEKVHKDLKIYNFDNIYKIYQDVINKFEIE